MANGHNMFTAMDLCMTSLMSVISVISGCFEYNASTIRFQRMHASSVGECYRICKDQTHSDGFGIRNAAECACISKDQLLPDVNSTYEKCWSYCSLYQNDRREYCGGESAISLYVLQDTGSLNYGSMQSELNNHLRCTTFDCLLHGRTIQTENCSSKHQPHCEGDVQKEGNNGNTFDETIQFCALFNQYVGLPPDTCRHFQSYRYWVDIYRYQIPILNDNAYAKEDGKGFQCGLLRNQSFVLSNCNSLHQGLCVTNPSNQIAIATGISVVIAALTLLGIVGVVAYRRRLCNGGSAPDEKNDNPVPQIGENYFVLEHRATHYSHHKKDTIPKNHKTSTIPKGYEDIYVEHDEGEYDELNKARRKIQNNTEDPRMYMHRNFNEETEDGVYNSPSRVKITEEGDYSKMDENTNYGNGNDDVMVEDTERNGDATYDHC